VSRLYDRIMAEGCAALDAARVHEIAVDDDVRTRIQEEVSRAIGRDVTDEEASLGLRGARQDLRSNKSADVLGRDELEGAIVVSAEEVADYFATLPTGTHITDVVSAVAPPFERVFVEFQRRPNPLGLESWARSSGSFMLESMYFAPRPSPMSF
jgi:hypothetical protein